MTPSTPSTAVTGKTVIHLPDRHPAWGWNAQPCTVSYSLACRDGWGDQVYDRLLDWARIHGLIVDDKEDEEVDIPGWDGLMALVPPARRLEAIRAAFDDPDAVVIDNPVMLVWSTNVRGGETLRDDGAVILEDWCNPVEDYTVHLEVLDPEGLGVDDPANWRAWNKPISGPWRGLYDGFTDDEPADPTDGDPFEEAENRLLAKAGIDRSHVWDVSTPW